MKVTQKFTAQDDLLALDSQGKILGKMVFEQCFRLKPSESVLIVTVPEKFSEATLLFEAAKLFSSKVQMLVFTGMTENAQEPPVQVVDALLSCNVAVLVTNFSLSHTRAREAANKAGARIASLPGITFDMMVRTLSADAVELGTKSDRLAALLTSAQTARLTSPAGTNLVFSLVGRSGLADTGSLSQPGAFGNLPAGEAFIAPLEGTTNGTLVIDGCLADVTLDAPVTVQIEAGVITEITGGKAAETFLQQINVVGAGAKIVAELGIGTNEKALVDSDVLEAEKALGTCHVAFGDNAGFGGINEVPFHSDGVVLKPSLFLDEVLVMQDGKLCVL